MAFTPYPFAPRKAGDDPDGGVWFDWEGTLHIDADEVCAAVGCDDDLSAEEWAYVVQRVLERLGIHKPGDRLTVEVTSPDERQVFDYGAR
jgi:hypothetical protein